MAAFTFRDRGDLGIGLFDAGAELTLSPHTIAVLLVASRKDLEYGMLRSLN